MRVQLKEIIIYNFKSFRGKTVISHIAPFTAVIGPNGSGKSNFLDAISFALAEKTGKLRVKQLQELIYGASIGKPISSRAYVTLLFQLEEHVKKSFTRTILDSSCEYKINDEVVALRSYMDELKQLGLNVKAQNFLIFQGTIESVIMKTPKEITQIIEELSGSSIHKAEYERLTNKVFEIQNEISYIQRRKVDLSRMKMQIQQEKQEADKWEIAHEQYLEKKLESQMFELFHLKNDIEDLGSELQIKKNQANEYIQDKESAVSLLKQKNKQLNEISVKLDEAEEAVIQMKETFKEKETVFAVIKEEIAHLEKKLSIATSLLKGAQKSDEVRIKNIADLKNEMAEVEKLKSAYEENMATQLLLSPDKIEFNNEQVQQYYCLKVQAQKKSLEYIQCCDTLNQEQNIDENRLSNEKRKNALIEDKLKQKKILKSELEKRLEKLQQYVMDTELALTAKTTAKTNLEEAMIKHKESIDSIHDELKKICEDLSHIEIDNYLAQDLQRKTETVKTLQGLFSNVYGRICDICRPIDPRYNTAVTKVLGKHMQSIVVSTCTVATECIHFLKAQKIGVETFLPLNSLNTISTNKSLCNITELENVKLLYDVLEFEPKEISNAILFVTRKAFVCETPEDARIVAYEIDPNSSHNCVAIDGTFYTKSGLISGGQMELTKKAKIWENKRIQEIKSKKAMLMEKLRLVPNISEISAEIHESDIDINGLNKRLKYSRHSLIDIEKQITLLKTELDMVENELNIIHNNITSINASMNERNEKIRDAKRFISDIENKIFENFCKSCGLRNIAEYEERDLRFYQQQTEKKSEFEAQQSRIQNLLDFETSRDTKSEILKREGAVATIQEKLEIAHQKETFIKSDLESIQRNFSDVCNERDTIKEREVQTKNNVEESKHQVAVITKLIKNTQWECVVLSTKIEKKKAGMHAILKSSKVEGIIIPFHPVDNQGDSENAHSLVTSNSSFALIEEGELQFINFSELSDNYKNREDADIQMFRNNFRQKIIEIQSNMKCLQHPNLKANEKLNSITDKLKETSVKLRNVRENAERIKEKFENVKQKRYALFKNSFEHITKELDRIYKKVVKNVSAEAMLVPENPEEPYLEGIRYSCIVPGKRFQALSNLSGGEKTVAALAFLFALHSFKPAPFLVLDETDASLDKTNIKKVVSFLQSKVDELDILIISLKKELFTNANSLIGICSDLTGESPESLIYILPLSKYPHKTQADV